MPISVVSTPRAGDLASAQTLKSAQPLFPWSQRERRRDDPEGPNGQGAAVERDGERAIEPVLELDSSFGIAAAVGSREDL